MAAEKGEDRKKAEEEAAKKKKADAEAVIAAAAAAAAKKAEEEALLVEIPAQVALIERSATTKDPKAQNRVLRQFSAIRRKLAGKALVDAIAIFIPDGHPLKPLLAEAAAKVPNRPPPAPAASAPAAAPDSAVAEMEVDAVAPLEQRTAVCMEVEAYLCALLASALIDAKLHEDAVAVTSASFARVIKTNQRTLDAVGAKVFFLYSRAHELCGRLASIRSTLLGAHRTAVLHHNQLGQVVLLNLLLANYLSYNLYDQADKLVAKSSFPDSAPNNQLARHLYYLGRLKAVQLDYSEAHGCLLQAQRKAPQHAAVGFRLAVAKLTAVVQLLLGEVPARSALQERQLERPLRPYLQLVQAVRQGDLALFRATTEQHGAAFLADRTHTLIVRLRQNVIRTGLRNVSLAYTRISLADICARLRIERLEDVESIVAKAIRDKVIDAHIDFGSGAGVLVSSEVEDLYATLEPQAAFHKRTSFCLNVHNDAVKALSFPHEQQRTEQEDEAKRKERLREEAELAQSLAEEEDDDF